MKDHDVAPESPRLNETWIDSAGILRYWDGEKWELYEDIPPGDFPTSFVGC